MTAAKDTFPAQDIAKDWPAENAIAVTTSDTVDLANVSRGIWVGVTGNIAVNMEGTLTTNPITFVGVQAGTLLPIRCTRVMATNTTATNIVAVF